MNTAKIHSQASFSASSQQLIHASSEVGIRFSASENAEIVDPNNPSARLKIIGGHFYYMTGNIIFIRASSTFEVKYNYTRVCQYLPATNNCSHPHRATVVKLPAENENLIAGTNRTSELRIKEGVFATLEIDPAFDKSGWVPFSDEHGQTPNAPGNSPVLVDGNVQLRFQPSISGAADTILWVRYLT